MADLIVRWRWVWVALALAMAALSAARLDRIWPLDPDARVFFDPANPDRIALDEFEAVYTKDDNLMIVVVPGDGAVFTPRTLRVIGEITDRAWLLPYVRRVDSLTNFQHTYAEGDELVVRDLVPDPAAVTPEEAAEARRIALSRIELADNMLTERADMTLVQVRFILPGTEPTVEGPSIVAEAEALVAEVEAANPGVDLRLSGSVMINNQYAVAGEADGATLTPGMFLAILLVVGLALRSAFGVIGVLSVIVLSALTGLGALGWSGLPLNSVTILAPLYIMTLAVASAVHILSAVRQNMADSPDRRDWVRKALTDHMGAIIVACVTTAIGFFSLNFSISPPFQQLGTIVGVGVLAAMVYTLTLLPALITFMPLKRRTGRPAAGRAMDWIAEFVIANRRLILPGMSVLVVAAAAGVSQLKLEDDFIRYFDERFEFRRDADFIEANLTGLSVLEYKLDSGAEQGVNDPGYLADVHAFAAFMRAQPEVTYVRTLTDTLMRLNMNMNGDDPAYFRLPETRDEASQFLFLYELSLGYGMDLTDQIDVGRSALRVSVGFSNVTTADMKAVTDRGAEWLAANAPGIATAPTGVVQVFNLISYRDVRAMLTGTALAILLISGVIMLALRDLRVGLISLIPNFVPAAVAFGLWGYSVGAVTLAIAVVIAATLGIVVDDTVHFLSKYVRARKQGLGPEDSVRYAFRTVGMALLVTTLGLIAGFGVLAQSGFSVNGDMAKLTALTIAIALVADFLLLPALLIWIDRRFEAMKITTPAPAAAALALALGLGALLTAGVALAQTPQEKGLAIATEADARDLGFGGYRVEGEMILRDANGRESRRAFVNMMKEEPDPGLGDKGVIVFRSPRDIRGTGLLTHANIEPADDDQWLYLPALKRVKRISSSNRTGKFVSSEFSYEDLGSQEVADYDYAWLRDEPCPTDSALTCFVVESVPKNPKSGYSKRVSWIDSAEYRLQFVEFYNRRGDLEKSLSFEGYRQYAGKFWRADRMTMVNKQTGKATDLIWRDYDFGARLSDGDFNAQRLPQLAR